jgi:uncharacterized protein (DUF849 family)
MALSAPKFIQISTAVTQTAGGATVVHLHALDETGRVWQYAYQSQLWTPVPEVRQQEP